MLKSLLTEKDREISKLNSRTENLSNISQVANLANTNIGVSNKVLESSMDMNKIRMLGCFIAGTQVMTIERFKSIEDIEIGDKVLSKSDKTGELDYKEVTKTFIK